MQQNETSAFQISRQPSPGEIEFHNYRISQLKPFKRFIKRNGRIGDSEKNIIYQLSLINNIDIPLGKKQQIMTKCLHSRARDMVIHDGCKIDFTGTAEHESCIESQLHGYIATRNMSLPKFSPHNNNVLLIFLCIFYIWVSVLIFKRK